MEESSEIKAKPQRQLLIATDGSESAEEAADFGIEMVGSGKGKVYAVYVIDTTSYGSIPMNEIWSKEGYEQFEKMGREATAYVEEKAKAAGLEAESILLNGNPAEEIVNFAEEQKVDMIIVGSLGKGRFERVVLGSVSEKIVRHAKVPVLVVRERHKRK
ncbi:MAG: universal stress protein [Methanosarcina sp.]|jgi:nucleotide-binding universal stress UspA family protein